MMTVRAKLELLLATGITTEAQALHLMVLVRKLLEHQQAKKTRRPHFSCSKFPVLAAQIADAENRSYRIERTHGIPRR